MQTKIIGGGPAGNPQSIATGVEAAVDPLYAAFRIAMRPLDYTSDGAVLGHYAVAQKSGATVNIGALGHVGRIRWAPSAGTNNLFCVLMRIKVGFSFISAITVAVQMDFDAVIHRGYTVDHSAGITNANMASVPRTNAMRSGQGLGAMAPSQMGTSGPGICTTVVISGNTSTADNNPFAMTVFDSPAAITGTVTQPAGRGAPMATLYECTAAGQHPVVLSANEGVVIREVSAGPASGTTSLYVCWEWAEVAVF